MPESLPELLTVDEVAHILKVPTKRVYELPIRKTKIGRSVRYTPTAITMYLASCDERVVRRAG